MNIFIKLVLALVIIAIIAAAAIYVFIYNKPHPDFRKMKPAYTMNASDLFRAYQTDPAAANRKYTGQVIQISGACGKTETTDSLVVVTFVFSQGETGDEGIRCAVLPPSEDPARKLLPGTTISVKGFCTGFNDTDVIMEQCTLIR
jgi:hypothetical protein